MDLKVPTIDFRNSLELKKGSEKWNLLRDEVFKSLEEYGCFEALLDEEIPKEKLYEKLKQVFNFNFEKIFGKSQNVLVGYNRDNPGIPLQERMTIENVLTHGVIENFSNILWPEGEPQFCDLVNTYSKKLTEFGDIVRRMVFDKLGLNNYLDEHKKSGDCFLVLMRYRVPKAEETNNGIPPHTDKIISIILSQHDQDVNGFQIMDKNGQWLDVQYSSPHSYIFLVNDCLKAFTNGRLHSPIHRVIMGNEERYSMGISTNPKEGYIIKVPEELVDEDHPLLYKPFDGSKFLPFFLSEGRRGVLATIESFCGVSANNQNFDLMHTFSKKLTEFDDIVRRMIFDKLRLENYLDEHKNSGDCLFAMLKYRVPKAEETNVSVPPHTDKIISAILSQHDQDVNGLQIMDKNGQWLDVQYSSPHSYIFMASDCLKAFTNGRLHSPIHRVIMGNEERYSMGLSTIPKEGYIIKVPEELVDEDHPLIYKPFDGSKLIPFLFSEARRGVVVTLESFCGVLANNLNLS